MCLVDNLSVALCFSRRRSKEYVVISLIRRLVAIGLTRNIKIYVRWIPSELNSSDAPSRFFDIDNSHCGPSLFEKLSGILGQDNTRAQPGRSGIREADELAESTSCDEAPGSAGPRQASREDSDSVSSPHMVSPCESARDGEETFCSPGQASESSGSGPGSGDRLLLRQREPRQVRRDSVERAGSSETGEIPAYQELATEGAHGGSTCTPDLCGPELSGAGAGNGEDGGVLRGRDDEVP